MHRLSRRPAGYIIAVVLGVAGVGGLSTALAEQGQGGQGGQGQGVSSSQSQGQGSSSQGQGGQGGQGQGQGQTDCGQGQGSNCSDCGQGQGQGCTPEVGSENAETPVREFRSEEVTTEAAPAEAVTSEAHFGG